MDAKATGTIDQVRFDHCEDWDQAMIELLIDHFELSTGFEVRLVLSVYRPVAPLNWISSAVNLHLRGLPPMFHRPYHHDTRWSSGSTHGSAGTVGLDSILSSQWPRFFDTVQ